jgi:hypothetical protein
MVLNKIITILVSAVVACLASTMMLYLALATPLGPWIEPVFVLLFLGLTWFVHKRTRINELLTCISAASGVAGIAAVGCAFSYPTFYFLNKAAFCTWLTQPIYFIGTLITLTIIAGALSFIVASWWETDYLGAQEYPFPEVNLVYSIITTTESPQKVIRFFTGIVSTTLFYISQFFFSWIPSKLILLNQHAIGFWGIPPISLALETLPMFVALGFVAGPMLIAPLITGALSKIILIEPLQKFFFTNLKTESVIAAWCSGMILASVARGIFGFTKNIYKNWQTRPSFNQLFALSTPSEKISIKLLALFLCALPFFFMFNFSIFAILYLFAGTIICANQLISIAAKVGLAPMGRFATFVMLPGLMIFGFTGLQATQVATFVEMVGGISVQLMFGRRLMQLTSSRRSMVIIAQIVGLLVAAVTIGYVFWLIGSHGALGQSPLIAQRALSRSLLIKAYDFNVIIVFLGALFGALIKQAGINTVLVMSGLFMPLDLILFLITGSLLGLSAEHRKNWYPFWASVFSTSSLILIFNIMRGIH